MKRYKTLLILAIFALLLAACATPSSEPAASESSEGNVEESPALAPVEEDPQVTAPENSTAPETEEENGGEGMIQPQSPTGAGEDAADPDKDGAPEQMTVAPSGSVNLSELTPEPPSDTGPREMPAPGIPGPASALIDQVKEDLSLRFNVALNTIVVLEMEEVTWPNSGLGCPQPGYAYMDVLVDGQRIVLGAGNDVYEYHTGGGSFVFCKDGVGQPRISPAPGAPVAPVNPSDT